MSEALDKLALISNFQNRTPAGCGDPWFGLVWSGKPGPGSPNRTSTGCGGSRGRDSAARLTALAVPGLEIRDKALLLFTNHFQINLGNCVFKSHHELPSR